MQEQNDEAVSFPTAFYRSADVSPAEFESFVVNLLEATNPCVDNLTVTLHDRITGIDGSYEFDATVRFELGDMAFLVIVEAKRHTNPIKRELVQVLHQKLQSVGAQKGAMISTAPYQVGALKFAKTHGIALMKVTEGRFTIETRAVEQAPTMSRREAFDRFGLPYFVGHVYGSGKEAGSTSVTLMSTEYPEHVAEKILGVAES